MALWKYKKKWIKSLKDIPNEFADFEHFIYKITCKVNGRFYIGKKILFNNKKIRLSKKKRKELKTRRIFEYKKTESDWLNYYGSSKELLDEINILGIDKFDREIIQFVKGKRQATAWELYWIIKSDALISDLGYNGNILGRIFKSHFKE